MDTKLALRQGTPWKDFRRTNAPTVGPGIKSMGARMGLQHAKGNEALFVDQLQEDI